MSYSKHNFQSGDVLMASQLNEMDDEIEVLADDIDRKATKIEVTNLGNELTNLINSVIAEADDETGLIISK